MMRLLSLNGAWRAREAGPRPTIAKPFPARVPGCVHLDLRRARLIPDPYFRDNERALGWIAETDWIYARSFTAPPEIRDAGRALLRSHGLDTLAVVTLNGRELGRTDNQFRAHEWDIGPLLLPGRDANKLEIRFASANRYVRPRQDQRPLLGHSGLVNEPHGRGYIRKSQCNFGWDWGPVLITAGLWRDIEVVAFDTARLADTQVTQVHAPDHKGKVIVHVDVAVECAHPAGRPADSLSVRVRLIPPQDNSRAGEKTLEARAAIGADGRARVSLEVANPHRWWPAGMGGQPLCTVEAVLLDADRPLDGWTRPIGLRTLRLVREDDQWGQSFRFEANGAPFFAKGANWIPADTFPSGVTDGLYDNLLRSAVGANMNMLRVWGGGIYESDYFYGACDRLGLCVWQDFMFACGAYPSFDPAWMANAEREFDDNIRRLRHHPCIALWCGNNELEQFCLPRPGQEAQDRSLRERNTWAEYEALFDVLIPSVLARRDPERDYIPSSEHTPGEGRKTNPGDPDRGDGHLWAVWHGKQPFEWYRTAMHRFCSEFGFQSFQEPRGAAAYTNPRDRNITSQVMEWHQRSPNGNALIMHYLTSWFRMPNSFESTLWLSQLQQGMSVKYAVEHWRRNMPRCMGALYWQLNDCWPVASWSSLDWTGRWKALHFAARKFYAPLLISGVEDAEAGAVAIHVTSDHPKPLAARVAWTLTDTSGNMLAQGGKNIRTPANGAMKAMAADVSGPMRRLGPERLLFWMELIVDGIAVSSNLSHFVKPKHLALEPPGLKTRVTRQKDGRMAITVSARKPALWAWLEWGDADIRWSDNFFSVRPGQPATVTAMPPGAMDADAFRRLLRVASLYETSAP